MAISDFDTDLNESLIQQQNLSKQDVIGVQSLHREKQLIFERFNKRGLTDDEIYELALELEDLEYIMQATWGFKQDPNFHTHWINVSLCTCKSFKQRFGKPKVINPDCKVHKRFM